MRKFIVLGAIALATVSSVTIAAPAAVGRDQPSARGKAVFDRAFIDAMVPHHRSAIAMAREALRLKLSKPILVGIAKDIIASQATEIRRMLGWRKAWYGSTKLDPNALEALGLTEMEAGMHGDPAELRGAPDIDKAFAAMMTTHHKGAITMAKLALKRASHQQIKTLARQIIAAQQREIELMKPYAGGGGGHHG